MPEPELTLEEVEADLVNTHNDESLCLEISRLITRFVVESGGEDRSKYKMDALRFKALASQAAKLKIRIQAVRASLKGAN